MNEFKIYIIHPSGETVTTEEQTKLITDSGLDKSASSGGSELSSSSASNPLGVRWVDFEL